MTLSVHAFCDISLLAQIRQDLTSMTKPGDQLKHDLGKLEKQPLLLSMYAETLRFGVQIHVPRTAPHRDLSIGNLQIPKNKLILINTWLAHTDETIWNSRNGTFPLDSFWAQRFLIDPKDPSSGPTKKKARACERIEAEPSGAGEVQFSLEGLEGAWIPYGGRVLFSAR